MADGATVLSTEQLLIELGKVVMGLGRKIESLGEKMDSIHSVLADDIAPSLKATGSKEAEETASFDMTPLLEKLDELKPVLEGFSVSFEQLPSKEIVETKLTEVYSKLEEILKVSENREYVETLSNGMSQVKEQLVSSGEQVMGIIKEVPEKIDRMGEDLSEAMKSLSDTTGAMLEKTEDNISRSNESLGEIKTELEKGLKLNTDMTSQMVDLTGKFADKAEEDRIFDLNTRAIGHFNRGEFTEADTLFGEALTLAPEDPELLCNTAHLKAAMEQMEESETMFRKALEVSPDLEPAISGLGMLMVKTGRAEETIEFLKNAIPDAEMSVRTVLAFSRALAAQDKHSQAVELLETSLRGSPNHPALKEELAGYGHEEKS